MNTTELRKAAKAIYICVEKEVADDISEKLNDAASEIDRLRSELSVSDRRISDLTGYNP